MIKPINIVLAGRDILIIELRFGEVDNSLSSLIQMLCEKTNKVQKNIETKTKGKDVKDIKSKKALLCIRTLDEVIKFSKTLDAFLINTSTLYKYQNLYYLCIDLNCSDDYYLNRIYSIMLEYAYTGKGFMCNENYLREHAKVIIEDSAMEVLSKM